MNSTASRIRSSATANAGGDPPTSGESRSKQSSNVRSPSGPSSAPRPTPQPPQWGCRAGRAPSDGVRAARPSSSSVRSLAAGGKGESRRRSARAPRRSGSPPSRTVSRAGPMATDRSIRCGNGKAASSSGCAPKSRDASSRDSVVAVTVQNRLAASRPWIGSPVSPSRWTYGRPRIQLNPPVLDLVAPSGQAVGPRIEQRNPERRTALGIRLRTTATLQQLLAVISQRAAHHPERRDELRRQGSGVNCLMTVHCGESRVDHMRPLGFVNWRSVNRGFCCLDVGDRAGSRGRRARSHRQRRGGAPHGDHRPLSRGPPTPERA